VTRAVVAFGSNIAPEVNVPAAIAQLRRDHRVLAVSPTLRTEPLGPHRDQPQFHNGAVLLETDMDASALVSALKEIEDGLGRPRGGDRWGPRTMDLDLVVWDGRVVDAEVHARSWLAASVAAVLGEAPAPAP